MAVKTSAGAVVEWGPDHLHRVRLTGDTVQILVQDGASAAQVTATLPIDRSGIIQNVMLRIRTEPDADGDSDADLRHVAVFRRCFTDGKFLP